MLNKSDTGLIIVDVQGKLASLVHESEKVIENIITLIKGAEILELPILWLEQYPKGLGPTIDEIKDQLKGQLPIEKMTFRDRKSTRLNSSHVAISYAVFCLKKKRNS